MMLDALADIGRNPGTGGYDRYSWTAPDLEARAWFLDRARAVGLESESDRNGNLWAWWGGDLPGTAFVCGSHLDSVPNGGGWDGPLGVAAAFDAVASLIAEGVQPTRPVGIVCFTEEEGARFGVACLGSRLLVGAIDADRALALTDDDGVTLAEAMRSSGHDPHGVGRDDERVSRIGEFVELHIEQGHLPIAEGAFAGERGLAAVDLPLGVASEIWPHGRWRLDFTGEANHAGTTPLAARRDPVLALARGVLEVRSAAEELDVLGTVGKLQVVPGAVNAIAASASAWVDARGADPATVRRLIALVEERLSVDAVEESWTAMTPFDRELTSSIRAQFDEEVPVLPSGAGHDAGVLALAGLPVAMMFVRNPTGVSHSPEERVDESDAALGAAALARVIRSRAAS